MRVREEIFMELFYGAYEISDGLLCSEEIGAKFSVSVTNDDLTIEFSTATDGKFHIANKKLSLLDLVHNRHAGQICRDQVKLVWEALKTQLDKQP